jgi:hypothetical protein
MRKILFALLMFAPWMFAQTGNCNEVSGAILSNFLDEQGTIMINGTSVNFYATTLGTATGDLRGAIGVYALSQLAPGQPVQVHHHWVTEAGDTIFLQDASASTFPIPNAPVIATANYVVQINGGTGRFAGANGFIKFFGGIDVSDPANPRGILRYLGQITFARQEE